MDMPSAIDSCVTLLYWPPMVTVRANRDREGLLDLPARRPIANGEDHGDREREHKANADQEALQPHRPISGSAGSPPDR
jgi:hypothetical protein